MALGAFSMSLNVKDLAASIAFYETLGFEVAGDYSDQGWAILRDGSTTLGLFGGHIQTNCLTFNPGWTQDAQPVEGAWEDVRAIQARLKAAGIELTSECDPEREGPAHIALTDPDGNAILIDQHR
ncbi:VOC family protein [Jannaschia ovalis]|uniref:VOC family protein n=1 Tax=Jannaschia ovalis TaxID=3038773 RepID=A0ABY8LD33_9RHOB|nr:VOC family protein [Jannaschia sp. GRR-S6-38]WGH78195.1 VOC family protein [Jannaschia sp. GRR-S6-38]